MLWVPLVRASIDIPPDWSARVLPAHCVVVVFPRAEEGWTRYDELNRSFGMSRTPTELSFGRFVRSLMRRRVPQGFPTVLAPLFVDEARAVGLGYTDGVHAIVSWFLSVERGFVHELSFSTGIAPDGPQDVEEQGRAFAARVHWNLSASFRCRTCRRKASPGTCCRA